MPCALGVHVHVVSIVLLSYYVTVHTRLSCILAIASNLRLICLLTQAHVCLCAMIINWFFFQTQSPKVKKQKGVHRSIITTGTIPVFDSPRPDTHQTRTESQTTPRNVLDSSAPVIRRGKERESPKKKKPSAIRKVRYTNTH